MSESVEAALRRLAEFPAGSSVATVRDELWRLRDELKGRVMSEGHALGEAFIWQQRAESAERQLAETREALAACIPWIASHPRSAAQEALAVACELVGSDPYDWTLYPDVLTRRRELLGLPDRRAVSPADTTEGT